MRYLKRPTLWLTLALILMLGLYLGCAIQKAPAANTTPAPVTVAAIDVDLARPGPPALAIGILNGPAPPLDSQAGKLIKKLHPRLWRSSSPVKTLLRARKYGAQPMIVVSSYWGKPGNWPGNPAELPDKWHKFMVNAAKSVPDKHWIWDIWNEPDFSFYDGTEKQFNALFITADRILHKIRGPKVQVAGPSLGNFDLDRLTRFGKSLMEAGVKLEVLAWHENGTPATQAHLITKHLNQARERFIENPEFAALGVKKLMITEYTGPKNWLRPAALIAFRQALEAGNADAIVRSCWKWDNGKSSCRDGSIDGLITPKKLPRAAWWAERALVPQSQRRVQGSAPSLWHVVANKHSLVLGSLQSDATLLHIRFSGLEKSSGGLQVCGRLIPDTGTSALPELAKPRCHNIYIEHHQATAYWHAPPPGAALWLHYTSQSAPKLHPSVPK